MELLYNLAFAIIILFVYRLGYSDGAKNNAKSPIKAVKDVVNDIANHKEIKVKAVTEKKKEDAINSFMNYTQESAKDAIKKQSGG